MEGNKANDSIQCKIKFIFKFFEILGFHNFGSEDKLDYEHDQIYRLILMLTRLVFLLLSMVYYVLYGRDRTTYMNFLVIGLQCTSDFCFFVFIFSTIVLTHLSASKIRKFYTDYNEIARIFRKEFSISLKLNEVKQNTSLRIVVILIVNTSVLILLSVVKKEAFYIFNQIILFLLQSTPAFFVFQIELKNSILNALCDSLEKIHKNVSGAIFVYDIEHLKENNDCQNFRLLTRRKLQILKKINSMVTSNAIQLNYVYSVIVFFPIIILSIGQILCGYRLLMMISDSKEFKFVVREWKKNSH